MKVYRIEAIRLHNFVVIYSYRGSVFKDLLRSEVTPYVYLLDYTTM